MLRSTHVNQTLTVWLATVILSMNFSIVMFFLPILAIIQDWDHHAGFMRKYFKIKLPFKHRGFTHTLLFILLLIIIINLVEYLILNWWNFNKEMILTFINENKTQNIFLFILLHGHLLGDFLTKRGIPYFFPLFNKNIWLGLFSTHNSKDGKSTGEMKLNFVHSIINIILLWYIWLNWGTFWPIIINSIDTIKNTNNYTIILSLIWAELIFIIWLFWKDISSLSKYIKNIVISSFKFLFKTILLLSIFTLIYFTIIYFWIDFNTIINKYFNIAQYNINANLIILIIWAIIFLLQFYKNLEKNLFSISDIISYTINVIYIIIWLLLVILF